MNIGDAGDDTTVVIRGNLQVDGTTTTINSTSLTVDDKIILCADGSSSESNTGTGGLEIEVGNSTQNPFVGFVDGAALTQMVVKLLVRPLASLSPSWSLVQIPRRQQATLVVW